MNLLEMAQDAALRVGADTEDEWLTVDQFKTFVKAGLRMVEADLDHPDWLRVTATLATVAGTGSYAVPSGWAKTISLRISTEDSHLPYVSREDLDTTYGATADRTGQPSAWSQEGGLLFLRPVPDSVLSIEHRYVRTEPDLTADTSSPLLPVRFHDAIIEWACHLGARRKADYARADRHEKAYDRWITSMRDEQSRVTTPARIRGR